jgi:aminoglycoside 3-N-acetyltransferase
MSGGYDCQELIAGLRALGVAPGRDLLVHSSLRAVGAVAGGAATVLRAVEAAAGREATIVVPTQTTWNSRSSPSFRAAMDGLDPGELEHYLASMPGFDPLTTPSFGMGVFAEHVRTSARARRSSHPQTSFAALGPGAAQCTADHLLECHLGESSPLGWLARRDAMILLLGVGYAACTAFHLAEYRLPGNRPRRAYHCRVREDDVWRECEFWDVDLDDSDFAALGARMDDAGFVRHGRVGSAESRLIPIRCAVEFALRDPSFRRRRRAANLSRVRDGHE